MRIATYSNRQPQKVNLVLRRKMLLSFLLLAMLILVVRAIDLQVFDREFLQGKGETQHLIAIDVSAYRGQIQDRNGDPLAISAPVQSVWISPKQMLKLEPAKREEERDKLLQMLKWLDISEKAFKELLDKNAGSGFLYLKRQMNPDIAEKIKTLKITGINLEREFKRYYPAGPVSGHVVGFTNIDDIGQEGVEAGFEPILKGVSGKKKVVRDGKGHIIRDVENIQEPTNGRDVVLTIDQRLQYLAYRELQTAVAKHHPRSAALVILDAKNGDILAAVNHPVYNPNNRKDLDSSRFRNRAIVDVFEPGSTIKPFVVAAALDGGFVDPDIRIQTHGSLWVGSNVVKDVHNYGTMDLTQVLKKSSNVAVTHLALAMPPEYFWSVYRKLGFGQSPQIGFPSEASGYMSHHKHWRDFNRATLSFGYGVSTSVLQLARAYTALADDGVIHSVSLIKREEDDKAQRVFKAETARKVREMMEHVTDKDGTAFQARVEGYRVAGKTGTVKKATAHGYASDRYFSVFVGMAPASNPRFVIAVMIDEPTTGQYYGGLVAAPVFAGVMAGALRVYGVEPDGVDSMATLLSKR